MTTIPMTSLQPASYLFDLARASHGWLASLGVLQASTVPGHASLAQNWRMDSRVGADRELHLESSGCFPVGSSGTGFEAAIREYYRHFLCRSSCVAPLSAFVEVPNAGNLIPFDQRPARNHELLHIASLKSLLRFALGASCPGKADFEIALYRLARIRLPDSPSDGEIEKLVSILQVRGVDTIKEFAKELSIALGDTEPHWWAAFAHEIGNLSATNDWTEAVRKTGQGHIEPGEWLLAWRYSPEVAGNLYRPTVAEAGVYAFHFPSPPLANYGITMPLAYGLAAVRELIHAPLKGGISAEACIGFGKANGDPISMRPVSGIGAWFQVRRREHAGHLIRHQPPHVTAQGWLTRHAILP